MSRQLAKKVPCGSSTLPQGIYYIDAPYDPATDGLPKNYSCPYSLRPSDAEGALRLMCQQFSLEQSADCTADFLQVKGIGRFCGTDPPPVTTAHRLSIQVTTDNQGHHHGAFSCLILSLAPATGADSLPCGQHVLKSSTQYSLISQNHPHEYGALLYCSWQLTADNPADKLRLSCGSFEMEPPRGPTCRFDWMRVNDALYCGTRAPSVFVTGALNIEYASGISMFYSGFNCTVQVGDPTV